MVTNRVPWESFEQWSATGFLVGGGLMTVFWALISLAVFMDIESPQGLFATAALVATFIGLLGLYPTLSDQSSRAARAGVGLLSVTTVGVFVIFVWILASRILLVAGMDVPALPPGIIIGPTVGGYALTVLLFGVASLWTGVPSRMVGVLLLAIFGVFALPPIAGIIWGGYPAEWMAVIVSGLQAVAILSVGYILRTDSASTDHTETSADVSM